MGQNSGPTMPSGPQNSPPTPEEPRDERELLNSRRVELQALKESNLKDISIYEDWAKSSPRMSKSIAEREEDIRVIDGKLDDINKALETGGGEEMAKAIAEAVADANQRAQAQKIMESRGKVKQAWSDAILGKKKNK